MYSVLTVAFIVGLLMIFAGFLEEWAQTVWTTWRKVLVLSILLRKFIFWLNRLGFPTPVWPKTVKGAKRLFYP